MLRPCMIIDHTHVLRGLCDEFHPCPTDGPVCELVTTLADDLDRYSQEVAKVLDPVWEREFAARHFTPDKSATGKVDEEKSLVKPA